MVLQLVLTLSQSFPIIPGICQCILLQLLADTPKMQLFVKGVSGRTHRLEVGRHATIDAVKNMIHSRTGGAVAPAEHRLIYAGKELLGGE